MFLIFKCVQFIQNSINCLMFFAEMIKIFETWCCGQVRAYSLYSLVKKSSDMQKLPLTSEKKFSPYFFPLRCGKLKKNTSNISDKKKNYFNFFFPPTQDRPCHNCLTIEYNICAFMIEMHHLITKIISMADRCNPCESNFTFSTAGFLSL